MASGWVELEGERTEVRPHAVDLGARPLLGHPTRRRQADPGVCRVAVAAITHMFMTWLPMTLTRADGSPYSLFVLYQEERGAGFRSVRCQAEEQCDDGTSKRFADVEQDLHFQDDNRRFTHGTITLIDGRRLAAAVDDHRRGSRRLPPRHRGLLRLERLGVRPVGRRPARSRGATSPSATAPRTPAHCTSLRDLLVTRRRSGRRRHRTG